jgi:hypothetical protein
MPGPGVAPSWTFTRNDQLGARLRQDDHMDATARRRRSLNGWVASVRWPEAGRALVGVAGLALLVVGAVKFAGASGDGGTIALVIVGAILLVCPFVLNRLQRVSVGTTQVDLWLTTQVADRGAPEAAAILQRTQLGRFAEAYAFVHDELEGEYFPARMHLQDTLVLHAASVARQEKFDAREVRRLFADGSMVMRVLVLGLMQGDTSLADPDSILSAIREGRSRNEQFQALVLAQKYWKRMSSSEQTEIRWAIEQANFEPGSDRQRKAAELLVPGPPDQRIPDA